MSGPDRQIFDSHPKRHVTSIPIYLDSRIRRPQAGLSSQLYHRILGLLHDKHVCSSISNDIGSVKLGPKYSLATARPLSAARLAASRPNNLMTIDPRRPFP